MNRRRHNLWGVLLLVTLLLAAVSCEKGSTSPPNQGGQGTTVNNAAVRTVTLTADRSIIRNYLGKTDQLTLTANALDIGSVGVENATVSFQIISGPGSIQLIDDVTNAAGVMQATYEVTLNRQEVQTVTIEAESNGQRATITLEIVPRDVLLSMRISKNNFLVPIGEGDSTNVILTVSDTSGVGVEGIPIRIERIKTRIYDDNAGEFIDDTNRRINALLTPVIQTGPLGSATSTLTLNPVLEQVEIIIKATISLPPVNKGVQSKGNADLRSRIRGFFHRNGEDGINVAGFGGAHGIAESDTVAIDTIRIGPYENEISDMTLWIDPDHLVVPQNQASVANISAIVYDENHVGIRNLSINFSVENIDGGETGVISNVTATDSTGTATAILNTNRKYGNWRVTARFSEDPEDVRTSDIFIEQAPPVSYTFDMVAFPQSIYADMGITTSNISIRLVDQDDIAVVGDTIYVAATDGFMQSRVVTDSTGRFSGRFYDIGLVAQDPPARVTAYYRKNGVTLAQRSVNIIIDPVARPTMLRMFGPTNPLTVNPVDSIQVTVRVQNENNEPVQDGTPVFFDDPRAGFFRPDIDSTNNGVARSYYFWGSTAMSDVELKAYTIHDPIDAPVDTFWTSDNFPPFIVDIIPARAAFISSLEADRPEMSQIDLTPNIITCTVVDSFQNPVFSGTGIQFSADKGTITPSASTNENGQAFGEFTAGAEAGLARIQANLNSIQDSAQVFVNILSGRALSIELYSIDQGAGDNGEDIPVTEIQVAGTGGRETAIVTAVVRDAGGNPVDSSEVFFWLVNSPIASGPDSVWCRLDGSTGQDSINVDSPNYSPGMWWDFSVDPPRGRPMTSKRTNAGSAQVPVTSGTSKGTLELVSWVYLDEAHTDSAVARYSGIQIVAGPPSSIDVDVRNDGTDAGGGVWQLEASARVQDARGNDVACGYAVIFGTDDGFGNDDDRVHIDESYTCSVNVNDDSTKGVAYTSLFYHSRYTNQEVTIFGQVDTPDGPVTDYYTFLLPIQQPQGLLYTDVLNWNYGIRNGTNIYGRPVIDNVAEFYITAYLTDGHDHWINDQSILFLTNKGRFYSDVSPGGDYEHRWDEDDMTGIDITGSDRLRPGLPTDGWADLWLVITIEEGFPEPVPETTAQVQAQVLGYADATIEPIVLTLYQGPQ